MENWKKILLRAAGFGGGFAIVGAIIIGIVLWWSGRPVKPKPWNKTALKASYSHIEATGDKNFEFWYVVKNDTDNDYTFDDSDLLHTEAKADDGSLHSCKDCVELQQPVFIPAHESASVAIVLKYKYPDAKPDLTDDERKKQRTEEEAYLAKEMPRLNGFSVHDERNRYEIEFPSDWKKH